MKIIRIISEHKRLRLNKHYIDASGKSKVYSISGPKPGYRRVEAIIEEHGILQTRHVDVPKEPK